MDILIINFGKLSHCVFTDDKLDLQHSVNINIKPLFIFAVYCIWLHLGKKWFVNQCVCVVTIYLVSPLHWNWGCTIWLFFHGRHRKAVMGLWLENRCSYKSEYQWKCVCGVYVHGVMTNCCFVSPLRLAKATLTLVPLFGVHEIIFIFATDEQTTGVLRYIKVFFTLSLNSFQVGLRECDCLLFLCVCLTLYHNCVDII